MNLSPSSPPRPTASGLTAPERDLLHSLSRLERYPSLTVFLLFSVVLAVQLFFTSCKGWPLPSLHDEFSYLLSADTLAQGRFSNPVHSLAAHFETFHVLQQPSYASKYPLLPGALLALGQILGHPALGVFLGSAGVVAALCWALRPILGHLWSLFAALLAWSQFAPYSYYSSSFMSGNVSALGSCLLIGAAIRLLKDAIPAPRNAVLLGGAVFILAASRPFEGLVICLGVGLLLLGRFFFLNLNVKKIWIGRIMLPGFLTLCAGAGLLLSYNHAVTGNAFLLPYSAYESTHSRTPLFVWGKMRDSALPSTPLLETFEKQFTEKKFQTEEAKSFVQRFEERFSILLLSFIPFWYPALFLLLLSTGSSNRWSWFAWAIVLVFMTACSFTVWFSRHYLGCLLPFLCLISAIGAVQLCHFRWRGISWGLQLFRAIVWSLLLFQLVLTLLAPSPENRAGTFAVDRMKIQRNLQSLPGLDLILVSYGPRASVHEEWVYNAADIDASPVVWAHSLGKDEDEKLMGYFSNRRVWRLQVDQEHSNPVEIFFPEKQSPKQK